MHKQLLAIWSPADNIVSLAERPRPQIVHFISLGVGSILQSANVLDTVQLCREDAVAVLELYLGFVAEDTADMDAQALQQLELQQILAYAQQTASRQAD